MAEDLDNTIRDSTLANQALANPTPEEQLKESAQRVGHISGNRRSNRVKEVTSS